MHITIIKPSISRVINPHMATLKEILNWWPVAATIQITVAVGGVRGEGTVNALLGF